MRVVERRCFGICTLVSLFPLLGGRYLYLCKHRDIDMQALSCTNRSTFGGLYVGAAVGSEAGARVLRR